MLGQVGRNTGGAASDGAAPKMTSLVGCLRDRDRRLLLVRLRELRRAQHRARLDEQPTQFPPATLARERDAVVALWQAVFA